MTIKGFFRRLSAPTEPGTALSEVEGDRDAATSLSWFGFREAEDSACTAYVSGGGDTCADLKAWQGGAATGCVTTVDTRTPPLWEAVGAGVGLTPHQKAGGDSWEPLQKWDSRRQHWQRGRRLGPGGASVLVTIAWAGGADTEVIQRGPGGSNATPLSPWDGPRITTAAPHGVKFLRQGRSCDFPVFELKVTPRP